MKLKLLMFLTLITVANTFSQFTLHNVDACRKLPVAALGNGATVSLVETNPDATTGNTLDYTATNVTKIISTATNSNVTFNLPVTINEGEEFTFTLKAYSANAGSNNSGSGRVEIRFINKEQGISGASSYSRFRFNKVAGWQEFTGTRSITGRTHTSSGLAVTTFNAVQILTVSGAETIEDFYFDNFTIVDNSGSGYLNPVLADTTSDLEAGNTWYYNDNKLGVGYGEFRVNLLENQATPTTDGNASVNVLKLNRAGNTNHHLRIFHGDFDQTAGGVIKFRIYPVCRVSQNTTPNIIYKLRKNNSGTEQYYTDRIYLHEGIWNEIEISIADLINDGTVTADNLYDTSLFEFNTETGGNNPLFEYYIDSFQGPQGVTTFTAATDSDWATETNWSANIPGTSVNTIIAGGATAIVNAATGAEAKDLTVTGSLAITSGGSLIVDGTSAGNITYNVNVADTNWHLVSSPVVAEQYDDTWVTANSVASGSTTPSNRGIATYDNGTPDATTGHWRYFQTGGTATNFNSGIGYSLKRTASGNYSFTGTVPTADVNPTITQNENNWNLVGNPFTSYLAIEDLISANNTNNLEASSYAIYVWNGTAYTGLTTGFLHPGQAFFINSKTGATALAIAESLQSHQTGVTFYRTSSNDVTLDISLSDGNKNSTTTVSYLENKRKGLDPGFDIGMFDGVASELSLYTKLVEDYQGVKFEKQALGLTDLENTIIPLGLKAAADTEITFTVATTNLPSDVKIYLEDRATNTFIVFDEASRSFKIKTDAALSGTGRFYIHASKSALSVDDQVFLNSVSIYKSEASTIRITGLSKGNAKVKVFNILGKNVFNTSFNVNTTVKEITLPNLSTGVYVVQLQTESGRLNKKIILE